jgi:suppressor of fused-like protein
MSQRYAIHGPWLQVLIPDEFIDQMLIDLDQLSDHDSIEFPKTYNWTDIKLSITLVPEEL